MQHAIGAAPDPAHGYCVDDVARALQVDLLHCRVLGWPAVADSAHRGIRFLQDASRGAGGGFRNFRQMDGSWVAGRGSEDSQGRAMLALGETIAAEPDPYVVDAASDLWARSLPGAARPTALRAHALIILGCVAVLSTRDGSLAATTLEDLASRLLTRFRLEDSPGWPWPEPVLTYENALLPRALIEAGRALDSKPMVETGLGALDWLIAVQAAPDGHLSPIGNGWWPRGGDRSRFDQQPIEATALLLASKSAFAATGDHRYAAVMEQAYGWFLGENDNRSQVADPALGASFDGLTPTGVNANQGAESTLMWLTAAEHIRALRSATTLAVPVHPSPTAVAPQHLAASLG